MHSNSPLGIIGHELGIRRFLNENDLSHNCRIAYSAVRFWIDAFCLDMESGGHRGISKATITSRLNAWTSAIKQLHPAEMQDEILQESLHKVTGVLIDIGELAVPDFSGRTRCRDSSQKPLSTHWDMLLGIDALSRQYDDSADPQDTLISGLLTLQRRTEPGHLPPRTFCSVSEVFDWKQKSDLEGYEFLDPAGNGWGIRNRTLWTTDKTFVDDLALVRNPSMYGEGTYFVARRTERHVFTCRISTFEAQELRLELLRRSGATLSVRYTKLDDHHIRIQLPLICIQNVDHAYIKALTWPDVSKGNHAIARTEALEPLTELLARNQFKLEEFHAKQ